MQTSGHISEHVKNDVGILPKSLASTSETGAYFSLADYTKALFTYFAAAMANGDTVVAQVMEAKDAAGTDAQALTGATATITATTKATKALLTGNTIADGTTVVTVTAVDEDGNTDAVTYTCQDTNPDQSAGEFASGANDTEACANLANAINALQGDRLLATASSDTVILTSKEPGKHTITLSDAHSTIVPSVLEAQGFVEVDHMDLSDGYSHVALKLTTDATIVVGAACTRTGGRFGHKQAVAASKVL